MTENKRELDLIYHTYKGLTLSELEDAFSNAETPEKTDFFLKLYNLKNSRTSAKDNQRRLYSLKGFRSSYFSF